MKKMRITTPENIELDLVLSGAMSRAGAAFIDTIIQTVFMCLVGLAVLVVFGMDMVNADWLLAVTILVETLIHFLYYMVSELTMNGQTIGKKVLHLRVIKENGGPITAKEAIIRNLFRIFIDEMGVGIIMIFFGKKNKRLGDIVSGTIVVTEEKQVMPRPLESYIHINEEVRSYLTEEEMTLLRDYFNRQFGVEEGLVVRDELKAYFRTKLIRLGIYEDNKAFIEGI